MAALGFASTTDDVLDGVDLTGVTVLVTGTSAGLGVETARALAARGATVAGVVRDLDDPGFERTPYDPWVAYGRAKTANILFAVELDRRLRDRGVRATAVHPGGIATELGRHLTEETRAARLVARRNRKVEWKSVPQGAATSVWAGFVAAADEVGGRYCEDCAVSPLIDDPDQPPRAMRYALDPDTAAALRARSEAMVGESFAP